MTLDRLILSNFKNYGETEVSFCANLNCLVGNNGAGKTNLLDAIYYLSFCKSYFNPIDIQNIRQGADYFAIHGHYGDNVASCVVRKAVGKQMKWNKKACKTLAEHIGRIPLVMICPNDQTLITGGSEGRRRFVDGVISQVDSSYLDHLLRYNKALEQRNQLLKRMWNDRLWDEQMVDVWDMQLAVHGEYLYAARQRFIEDFTPLFNRYHHSIAESDGECAILYERDPRPLDEQLQQARQTDRYAQYTTVGPHKDDLQLMLTDQMSVKRYGSQGQQKSFALSLKLAQFQYLLDHIGTKPILLLDDVFDKLDLVRVKHLIALVGSEQFGQVFLTDTQPGRIEAIFQQLPSLEHLIFNVQNGTVSHADE